MRIGLDLYFKQKNGAGINNYVEGIFNNLLDIDHDNEYIAIGEDQFDLPIKSCRNIAMTMDYTNRYDFMAYYHELDIMHSVFYPFYGLNYPCKKVLTVHDLIPLIFKDKGWGAYPADYYEGPIRQSALEADCVVTVSKATKDDVVKYFGVNPDKIKVIYNGLYKPLFGNEAELKVKPALYDGDYFLSVSTMGPYKNFKGLVEAYVILRDRHPNCKVKLVLTGKVGWAGLVGMNIAGVEKYKDDIIFTGYVDEEQLYRLYHDTKAFIFPSFYEGFGIPALEAMSLGKAVISSNTSSLPEVCGEAAEYCDPYSLESMVAAMENVYFDDNKRKLLESKSIIQAGKFSYRESAKKLLEVYKGLM